MRLPQEIIDMILLKLPYSTLQRTRDIQNNWVKYSTYHESIYKSIKCRNKRNLLWLIKNNYPLDSVLFERVIGTYNLELLKVIRDEGCPWDENAILSALAHHRMDIFNWLLQEGCPFSYKSISYAKKLKNKKAETLLKDKFKTNL